MSPRDIVQLASTTAAAASNPLLEARCRASIGRSYYGAFHCAVEALGSLGVPPNGSGSGHVEAYRLLQKSGDNQIIAAGNMLSGLHTLRHIADYKLMPTRKVEDRNSAIVAANEADKIKSELELLLANGARMAAVRINIRAHYAQITGRPLPP